MVAASPQGETGTEEWETTPFVIFSIFFENSFSHFLQPPLKHIQHSFSTVGVLKYLQFGVSRRQYPYY